MKNDRHFPSQCGSGTFEAEPLPQHEAPTAERTFLTDPRQEHSGSFVKQSAQLAITTPRDVAIVVHFSRLEAPRCETEPGTNRARPLEGIGPLECGDIGDGGDGPNPRHRHEPATGRVALHRSDDTRRSNAAHLPRATCRAWRSGMITAVISASSMIRARTFFSNNPPAPLGTIRPNVFRMPRIWFTSASDMLSN